MFAGIETERLRSTLSYNKESDFTENTFTVKRLAILSLHTSPLAQPGVGDGGGMNVYVREFASALAQTGVRCRVYVRDWCSDLPPFFEVEPGFEIVHVEAGPCDVAKEQLPHYVDEFAQGVAKDFEQFKPEAIHANYWLSGIAGNILKRQFDLPLLTTFHTLARVKAESGDFEPESRAKAEAAVMGCADVVVSNCEAESDQLVDLYDVDPERIEIISPGVDHAFFSPGPKRGARWALQTDDRPLLLFVGRIQPLKGVDIAVKALAQSTFDDARLWIVGGASGTEGATELKNLNAMIDDLGLTDRVKFFPPQPHHKLGTYYRAADVCLIPSRSESFGLVALEAAACGTPCVASAVGGLVTLVNQNETGYLVDSRDPADYAKAVDQVLSNPTLAKDMSKAAAHHAQQYTWSESAKRLATVASKVADRQLEPCE